jgi:hypothetical protein
MTGKAEVRAFRECAQDGTQRWCAWCTQPVEGSGVYWWDLEVLVHSGDCNMTLHILSSRPPAEIWRRLTEHAQRVTV